MRGQKFNAACVCVCVMQRVIRRILRYAKYSNKTYKNKHKGQAKKSLICVDFSIDVTISVRSQSSSGMRELACVWNDKRALRTQ